MSRARYFGGTPPPAKSTSRSGDGSNRATPPKQASSVRTDGTEYQTEICSRSSHVAIDTGNVAAPSGSTARQAAAWQLAKTSKTDRSKCSGAGLLTRSCSPSPAAAAAHSTKASELRWEIITPFGVPVDPDVYRM